MAKNGGQIMTKIYKDNEGNEFLVYEDQDNQVMLTERLED